MAGSGRVLQRAVRGGGGKDRVEPCSGRLHRAEDLAERLGTSARTIYRDMDRLIASGELAAIRVGTAPRIPAKVLERFVDQAVRNVRIDNR